MIRYIDTSFSYEHKPVIRHFSYALSEGTKHVFYGGSGVGKSTLLHALMGFVQPDSGNIVINSLTLSSKTILQIRRLIAWLPQEYTLPNVLVHEAVYAPFKYKGNEENRPTKKQIVEKFETLSLDHDILDRGMQELSGGQRQRVMLATALLLKKPILLLDEPTSALDAMSREIVIEHLKQQSHITMLAVSHDSHFIDAFDTKHEIKL